MKQLIITLSVMLTCQMYARVKLVAVPEKESTMVKMNDAGNALVTERQKLTLQKGINKVDFSWNGVNIVANSIKLQLDTPDKVKLLNVSYPPAENALVWEIAADEAIVETVSISYIMSGIDNITEYTLTVNKEETEGILKEYFIIRNFSGEDFKDGDFLSFNEQLLKNQNVPSGETKKILLSKTQGVNIKKIWTFDSAVQPWDPKKISGNVNIPVSYEIINAASNKLGKYNLPAGKVRVYQQDGSGNTIFAGEDRIELTPVGDTAEVQIGASRDIVVTQKKMESKIVPTKRDTNGNMILHNINETITVKIENFKDSPAQLTLLEYIDGEWKMNQCNMKYTLKDYRTLEFVVDLKPKETKTLIMNYSKLNLR